MRGIAAGVAAAAVAGVAVRRWWSARDALAAVRPELRSPLLAFIPDITARTLPVVRAVGRLRTPPGPGVSVAEYDAGEDGTRLRVLVAEPVERGPLRPAVLWIHSGGLVVGSPQFELGLAGPLVRELQAVVVLPDYRLAPEHPFPAALDDCMTTLAWMRAHAGDLGIDADRIAVAGPSAGGGLSAAVAQRCLDEGVTLRAQALVYPMLDDRVTLRDNGGRGRFLWTAAGSRFGWQAYLGRAPAHSAVPPYSAAARRTDLTGLAPAWIGVGDQDLLYDESVDYADRLTACGVPCELLAVPGMYHGAELFGRNSEVLRDFQAAMIGHLRKYL